MTSRLSFALSKFVHYQLKSAEFKIVIASTSPQASENSRRERKEEILQHVNAKVIVDNPEQLNIRTNSDPERKQWYTDRVGLPGIFLRRKKK